MAFSNTSQLKMLSGERAECIAWGEKAIALAQQLDDAETLSHALNNVGTVQLRILSYSQQGRELLEQSLAIALKNGYHEHVARAYTNLGCNQVVLKAYCGATKALEAGIQYCEERDLDSWTTYMAAWKARLKLETGQWPEAYCLADALLQTENLPAIVRVVALPVVASIKLRRSDPDALSLLLEAKTKALQMKELQRIIPVLVVLLEYEWLTGIAVLEQEILDRTIHLAQPSESAIEMSEFAFWLQKARNQPLPLRERYEGYQVQTKEEALQAAKAWERLGCPYEQALTLFEGDEAHKKQALALVQELGANAVYEKLKQEMRASGIRSIPRGHRESTRFNPALLTNRELDVLQLLKAGMPNKGIADTLFISAKTVDHHISSILSKLEVKSRAQAVHEALRLEILK